MPATALPDSGLPVFNELPEQEAAENLRICLDAPGWVASLVAGRPYPDRLTLLEHARTRALALDAADLEQALAAHPRIGEAPAGQGLAPALSRYEQSGVDPEDEALATKLREANLAYEERFGHVFLIRAAGRSGPEILDALTTRLGNDPAAENLVVREQLSEIAMIRLDRRLAVLNLVRFATGPGLPTVTISTHVLDSTTGRPATGMRVALELSHRGGWEEVAEGETDANGRIQEWEPDGALGPGTYQLVFGTGPWFAERGQESFYPEVTIAFHTDGEGHHHVPLLLAPYAYSTYRGS